MRSHCKSFILLLFILALALAVPPSFAARLVPVEAPRAMVASVHQLASRAGVQMMKSGGNAVDAAVATVLRWPWCIRRRGIWVAAVSCSSASPMARRHFIDYREKAPAAATANMYLDAQGNVIEDASIIGYKAIGVPGSVAGMVYAEKKYGKLSLARVMAPAIKLAEEGFALAAEDAARFAG